MAVGEVGRRMKPLSRARSACRVEREIATIVAVCSSALQRVAMTVSPSARTRGQRYPNPVSWRSDERSRCAACFVHFEQPAGPVRGKDDRAVAGPCAPEATVCVGDDDRFAACQGDMLQFAF